LIERDLIHGFLLPLGCGRRDDRSVPQASRHLSSLLKELR
jgi:hypothetical protein